MTSLRSLPRCPGPVALLYALALSAAGPQPARAQGARGIACPSQAELDEASASFGTGGDNERRAYASFLARYGRPTSFRQNGSDAEMTYGGGRGSIRISLQRGADGFLAIRCR